MANSYPLTIADFVRLFCPEFRFITDRELVPRVQKVLDCKDCCFFIEDAYPPPCSNPFVPDPKIKTLKELDRAQQCCTTNILCLLRRLV